MRPLLLFLIFALSAGSLLSADELLINFSDAPTVFINFGDKYPNQTFTGWIPAGTPLASDPSLQLLQGKTVKITGTIKLYRGKPEIEIAAKNQIVSE